MIVLLDTATPLCRLSLIDGEWRYDNEWQADRTLAQGLLAYLNEHLTLANKTWSDITGIGVFQGPGSFTGLRIGMTVLNTLADTLHIPIVGAQGDDWQQAAIVRLQAGKDDKLVMPFYGGDAHITKPRK